MSIQLIAAIILAVVFGLSATAKSRNFDRTLAAVNALTGTDSPRATAHLLTMVETLVAISLIVPRTRAKGAILALILLTMFSALIARSLRAGRTPPCFCFGNLSSQPISNLDLVRNAALGILAVVALVS